MDSLEPSTSQASAEFEYEMVEDESENEIDFEELAYEDDEEFGVE